MPAGGQGGRVGPPPAPGAWTVADAQSARGALQRLVDAGLGTYLGAASRQRQEIEPITTVQALGIGEALAQRLRTVAPAHYLLTQCLPAGQGRTGPGWPAALAVELACRQTVFRRVPEATDMAGSNGNGSFHNNRGQAGGGPLAPAQARPIGSAGAPAAMAPVDPRERG